LRDLRTIAVDDTVLSIAAKFADARLRTIDAIHLASALEIGAR
jgi:predicted nucleic acid-binding protein